MTTPTPDADRTDTQGRYTVIYEGDPGKARILNGEPAPGIAVGVLMCDLAEKYDAEDKRIDIEMRRLEAKAAQLRSDLRAAEANLIALAKMYGEACGALAHARIGEDELFRQKEEAIVALSRRVIAAEAERDETRASAQKMHRRCQQGEADLQSLIDHLRSGVDIWMRVCKSVEAERDLLRTRVGELEKAAAPACSNDPERPDP